MTLFNAADAGTITASAHEGESDALRRGDAAAWTRLFEAEYDALYRFLAVQVRDSAVAEDLAGQVFLEAIEGIGRYREQGRPIRAWLFAIARNRATDWQRRKRREEQLVDRSGRAAHDNPHVTDLLDALHQLPPAQAQVIHLRFVEGYALDEVAAALQRSIGAVKQLQLRGVRQLRALLSIATKDTTR